MFRSWIKRVSNQPYKRNTVKTKRVAGRANSATITPALYPEPGGRARICPEGLLQRRGGDAGLRKPQTHRTRDWRATGGQPKPGPQSTPAEWVAPTGGTTAAPIAIGVPQKPGTPRQPPR